MPVRVAGNGDRGVPEQVGDDLDVDARFEPTDGCGVPQGMDADALDAGQRRRLCPFMQSRPNAGPPNALGVTLLLFVSSMPASQSGPWLPRPLERARQLRSRRGMPLLAALDKYVLAVHSDTTPVGCWTAFVGRVHKQHWRLRLRQCLVNRHLLNRRGHRCRIKVRLRLRYAGAAR